MFVKEAAILFSVLIGVVVAFQILLAAGMPWGKLAMGGKFPGKFPPALRIASLVQSLILIFLAAIVLSKAGFIFPGWSSLVKPAIWFVVGISALATFLNLITRSPWERRIWAPVSVLLLILSICIAIA